MENIPARLARTADIFLDGTFVHLDGAVPNMRRRIGIRRLVAEIR